MVYNKLKRENDLVDNFFHYIFKITIKIVILNIFYLSIFLK